MSARSRVQRTAAFALWIALALCKFDVALAAEKMFFDIPSGPADESLRKYQSSTGLQVIWPYDDVVGITTNEVRGDYDAVAALMEMTRGTRLQFEFGSEDSVTLTVKPPSGRRHLRASYPWRNDDLVADRRSLLTPEAQTVTVIGRSSRMHLAEFGSPTLLIARPDIDAFAYGTTQDLLRTLPQVFGGGPTEDTHLGFEAQSNAGVGAGVNLRGLGAGSTLTLVNGRRIAGSGAEGIFTDISNLPLTLVDRIEILPDSSSTTYGADAVGGVVNFVLLDSFDGAQTEAGFSATTRGQLDQNRVSQLIGTESELFKGLLAVDFMSQDALPAADRGQARSDLTGFGGNNFDPITSNPGTILVGTRTWAVPGGQDGTQLTSSMLIPNQQNRTNRLQDVDLLASQQRWSVYATGSKNVGRSVELFADALLSQRDVRNINGGQRTLFVVPTTNAFYVSPIGMPVPFQMAYDFSDDLGFISVAPSIRTLSFATGADSLLGDRWRLIATAGFTSEHLRSVTSNTVDFIALTQALADGNRATAFNPFGDGSHTNPATLARIRGNSLFRTNSHMWSGNLTATREIEGPAGRHGKLSMGLDYRRQNFSSLARTPSAFQDFDHDADRTVKAAFASLTLPILGNNGSTLAPNRLELSLAGRYENYTDFGSITTPRFGLSWAPLQGTVFRGTWSKSFRPPNLMDLDESNNLVTLLGANDPTTPGGMQFVLVKSGKNAQLREEHARSWTLGFDLDVAALPGLSTAATYFNTTFTNRMNIPRATRALLSDPALVDLITLNPTREQQAEVCASAPFIGGTAASCNGAPVFAIADLRVRNSTLMRTSGVDLLAQYMRYLSGSTLAFRLDGTYILSFSEAQTPSLPLLERVSTQNYPIDLRLRGSLDWQRGPLRVGAFVNYYDDYRDIASTPQRHVSSWTTLDLNFSYEIARHSGGPLSGMTFSLSGENVFDRKPPFLNNSVGIGYDEENAELIGRFLSLSVRKAW